MEEQLLAELDRPESGIIDSHAHVVRQYFEQDQNEVIARAFTSGVRQMVNPAVTVGDYEELSRLCQAYPHLYMAIGQHPHEAKFWNEKMNEDLVTYSKNDNVVAIGECGLDFFYNHSDRQEQLDAFARQVEIARQSQKPVIVHCRDAWRETIEILQKAQDGGLKGVFHCFTGDPEIMPLIKKLDFYVSFSGILTYKNAKKIQACAPLVKRDRMLVETDCPFLAPQKVRGKRNEPAFVWFVAQKLAELRDTTIEQIATDCSDNARRLFNLPNL